MNYLICSIGKHAKLIQNMKNSIGEDSRIIVTANQEMLPALYFADKQYVVPDVHDKHYITELIKICEAENINAITTMLDVETIILAENRSCFNSIGVEVLTPSIETAKLCFDKYSMFEYLSSNEIRTIKSYKNIDDFKNDYIVGRCKFPVFVKPNTGRGSVGARKVYTFEELKSICIEDNNLIIQEYIEGIEIDVDVYVDIISHKPVSIFSKKKIEAKIGGTTKAISFKDQGLFVFIEELVSKFKFTGPINIEVFYVNGEYILTEINPRFSAAYLHAYGCGVDFFKLMENNLNGFENIASFGDYKENIIMMMYNDVLIMNQSELVTINEV